MNLRLFLIDELLSHQTTLSQIGLLRFTQNRLHVKPDGKVKYYINRYTSDNASCTGPPASTKSDTGFESGFSD